MSKILVTGATGQVGSELNFLSLIQKHGNEFHFLGHKDADITDAASVSHLLSKGRYDFIINCAAYTAVDKAESEREEAFKVNAEGAGILAGVARTHNCKLVHISTDFIFDGSISRPLLEDDKANPLGVYGASKWDGEKRVLSADPDALVIRTSWVYSSYGNNFVKTILRLCRERESLNIIYDQVGSPTYARDLAAAILNLIAQEEWKAGVYNYSNEGVASWYDFAIAIRDMAGLKTKINPIETSQYSTPAIRPKYSLLNKRKIKETYKLEIPYWRESLVDCIKLLT